MRFLEECNWRSCDEKIKGFGWLNPSNCYSSVQCVVLWNWRRRPSCIRLDFLWLYTFFLSDGDYYSIYHTAGQNRATYITSMYAITSAYFFIELVAGIIIIIISPEGYKFPLFGQFIVAAVYLIVLFGNMMADEHTAQAVEKHEVELIYVKESCSMLKAILSDISDKHLYRQVERAYDLIQASPVKSAASVHSIESQVINEIDQFRSCSTQWRCRGNFWYS